MARFVRHILLFLLPFGLMAQAPSAALEDRSAPTPALLLQAQAGFAYPLSPKFVSDYWSSSAVFSAGFGLPLGQNRALLFSFSHFAFNYVEGVVPAERDGGANEVTLALKTFLPAVRFGFRPYYAIALGYTLLRTPIMYWESRILPGAIDNSRLREPAHSHDAPTIGAALGLSRPISDEETHIFIEVFSAASPLGSAWYSYFGARGGLLFKIGAP